MPARTLSLFAACLLIVLAANREARAQVYKWVDDKGVTHYSEAPPDDKKDKSKKVDTSAPAGFGVSTAKGTKSVQDMETEFKQRRVARQEDEAKQVKAAEAERKSNLQKCNKAKQTVLEMTHPGGLYEYDDKNEKVYLTDEQRKARAAEAEGEVKQYCK